MQSADWTRAVDASSLSLAPQCSAVSAWFGCASSRLSQVAVCCVAGAAGAGVHVHVRLTLTLTLRPQHAPSHTWHRASVRQLCNCNCTCTSPAPGAAPLPLSATRRPQKQGLSAPPALHINTPPSSLPVHRSHPIIISVRLDLPRSRSFLRHSTSATLDDNSSSITSGSRQPGSTHLHSSASPQPSISLSTQPRAALSLGIHTRRDPSHPAGRSVD